MVPLKSSNRTIIEQRIGEPLRQVRQYPTQVVEKMYRNCGVADREGMQCLFIINDLTWRTLPFRPLKPKEQMTT